jgi:hypothetical protein
MDRKFIIINEDGEQEVHTIKSMLDDLINDGHSDAFDEYNTTDWIEGLLEFTNNDLLLEKGTLMFLADGTEVTILETIRLTGGFNVPTAKVKCLDGEHLANTLR